jgi:hypothetical protein
MSLSAPYIRRSDAPVSLELKETIQKETGFDIFEDTYKWIVFVNYRFTNGRITDIPID